MDILIQPPFLGKAVALLVLNHSLTIILCKLEKLALKKYYIDSKDLLPEVLSLFLTVPWTWMAMNTVSNAVGLKPVFFVFCPICNYQTSCCVSFQNLSINSVSRHHFRFLHIFHYSYSIFSKPLQFFSSSATSMRLPLLSFLSFVTWTINLSASCLISATLLLIYSSQCHKSGIYDPSKFYHIVWLLKIL